MAIITILSDSKNKITKEILDTDLNKTTTGHITQGTGRTLDVDPEGLHNIIQNIKQNECLCIGQIDGFDDFEIGYKEHQARRTNDYFSYSDGPSWLMVDFDDTNLQPMDALELLATYDPRLKTCGYVLSYSCSSHLYQSSTGKKLNKRDNFHFYFMIENGQDIERYGNMLFERLILDGHGKIKVTRNSGSLRLTSIIDRMIWKSGANREIFESTPLCCPDVESRRQGTGFYNDGPCIAWDDLLDLSPEERVELELIINDLRQDPKIQDESQEQRRQGRLKRQKNKKRLKKGNKIINFEDWVDSNDVTHSALGLSEVIKDNSNQDHCLLDILKDIVNWKDQGVPDPIDPWIRGVQDVRVGKDIARLRFDDTTGRFYIYSFHGGVEYDVLWDFDSVRISLDGATDMDNLNDIFDTIFDPSSGIGWILDDIDIDKIAKIYNAKTKEFGEISSSYFDTDARKIQKEVRQHIRELEEDSPSPAPTSSKRQIKTKDPFIIKLNSVHGMALVDGKARVITEKFSTVTNDWQPEFTKIKELKEVHLNDKINVTVNGEEKQKPIYEYWHHHPDRNTYSDVIFEPDSTTFRVPGENKIIQQGGTYNMWMGFLADMSKIGRCDKILWHIKHIWCGGNESIYAYTIDWLATLFQYPMRVGQPMLVLKGDQGAGKNILIDNVINRILGCHAISTADKNDLIGKFNAHLRYNLFIYLDEAFFAGDPRDKSKIKALINEYRTIEAKGLDKRKDRNLSKVITASNSDYVMYVEFGDRRHVYLPVSSQMTKNKPYFVELMKEINNGGREAFLDFMLKHKITLNLNEMPEGQGDQREKDMMRSAPTVVKFILDLFENGLEQYEAINGKAYGQIYFKDWDTSEVQIPKFLLTELYLMYCRRAGIRVMHMDNKQLMQELSSHGIYGKRDRDATIYEYGRNRDLRVMSRDAFFKRAGEKEKEGIPIWDFC